MPLHPSHQGIHHGLAAAARELQHTVWPVPLQGGGEVEAMERWSAVSDERGCDWAVNWCTVVAAHAHFTLGRALRFAGLCISESNPPACQLPLR